jgi:hypothetical protein
VCLLRCSRGETVCRRRRTWKEAAEERERGDRYMIRDAMMDRRLKIETFIGNEIDIILSENLRPEQCSVVASYRNQCMFLCWTHFFLSNRASLHIQASSIWSTPEASLLRFDFIERLYLNSLFPGCLMLFNIQCSSFSLIYVMLVSCLTDFSSCCIPTFFSRSAPLEKL